MYVWHAIRLDFLKFCRHDDDCHVADGMMHIAQGMLRSVEDDVEACQS